MKRKEEEIIGAYVRETENVPEMKSAEITPVVDDAEVEPPVQKTVLKRNVVRGTGASEGMESRLGYYELPVEELPTRGLFYPDGFKINIRSARGEEIKHWSTMNDQDIQQLSRVDDILNYIVEKCCVVKNPEHPGPAWRDLKTVDRMYIILAIKDLTFPEGENELYMPIDKDDKIVIHKDMIDFIKIPDELMEFYSSDDKCFSFDVCGQSIRMYIPSIGVNNWLKNYNMRKAINGESYDEDFALYAPTLIRDYRLLNEKTYDELVASTRLWGVKEWSVVSYVVEMLNNASEPKVTYSDKGGAERELPLTFQGGIKSIFVIPNPLRGICKL